MSSNLDADIVWYQEQIDTVSGALAALAGEPESPSRAEEQRVLMGFLGRYQATLEHLRRLKAMTDRASPPIQPEKR